MPDGNGSAPDVDLEEVDAFAEAAHAGQTRGEGVPYVEHPRAVRRILEEEFPGPVDDSTLAIALLHDVLEDCEVHPGILRERWGTAVQEGVTLLSRNLRALGVDRDDRIYWSGIRRGPRAVRLVKAADRLHNLREALAGDDRRRLAGWVDETRERLIPILEDAGETWWAERLAALLEEVEPA